MPQAWKEICRVGKHTYIDGETGQPKVLDATPEFIRYQHDQGKAMRAAGLSIPIPLEHNEAAKPMTAAQRAADRCLTNAGFVEDFDLRKVKDKRPDGTEVEVDAVFGLHDILNQDAAKNLSAIKWVSPWFSSFVDGDGKTWNGVISHSALTTRPRIHRQLPFPDLNATMSLAAAPAPFDPAKYTGKGIALSRAGLLRQEGAAFKPAYPMAFSLWSGVKLAVEEMPPKEKPKGPPKPEEKPAEKPVEKPGEPPVPAAPAAAAPNPADPNALLQPIEEALVDPDGDISVHDVLQDLLETVDILLEEGGPENFEERLYKALMEKMKANKGAGDPMATDPLKPPATPPAPTTPEAPKVQTPPIYMSANLSLEQVNAIPNEQERGIALSLYKQRIKVEALEKNALEGARAARRSRVETVKKKLPKVTADALQKLADGAAFSLGDDGVVKDAFAEALDVFEKGLNIDVPAILRDPQAAFAVMPHPEEHSGGISEERRQAIVNESMKSSGREPAYK